MPSYHDRFVIANDGKSKANHPLAGPTIENGDYHGYQKQI